MPCRDSIQEPASKILNRYIRFSLKYYFSLKPLGIIFVYIGNTPDMKYLLTLIMPLMLFVTACEKTEYVVPNRTVIVDLRARDWITEDNGRTYEALIDLPEYDDYLNDQGAILIYAAFEGQNYEQIPQVYNKVSYSYVANAGSVLIQAQRSDGIITVDPPASMRIKIVLIDSSVY